MVFCLSVTLLAGHTINDVMMMLSAPFSGLFNKIISLNLKGFFSTLFQYLVF